MRSRFLAADYFAPSHSAAASSDLAIALAFLPFPSLPVPTTPPDPHLPNPFHFPADFLPEASVAGDDLDSLPFGPALNELLAAVVPQPLPVPDFPADDEGLDDYLYGRGVYGDDFSATGPVAFRIPKGLDDNHTKGDKEEGLSLEASAVTKRGGMLEVPEVDFLLVLQKKIASLDDEEPDAFVTYSFGVPDVKIHLDFIDIDTETRIPYPAELVESIYQVEVPVKHDADESCPYAKDSYCMEIIGLENGQIIPQLEVGMNSWELDECPAKTAVSNNFHNIVEHLYDGAQVRLPSFGSTELLRSCDMDIFALVCKDAPCVEYQADEPITAKDVAEMDFVRINHDILLDKKSALYPLKPDGTCSDVPCSILLEEVETINFPSEDAFKTLVQSVKEMNTSEEIFEDDFDQAKCFSESVVSSEWALVDDTFKSLPTPILPDDKAMRSMLTPIEVLCSLKPLPLSAADGIYLDWHLLSEGPCNQESCSTYASMVEEVKPCSLSSELQISCQQMPALDIGFLEDFPRSAKLRHEYRKNEIYVSGPISHDPPANLETTQKNIVESDVRGHSHMDKLNPEKESSFFESKSQSNGLSFYLNVRNDTDKRKNEDSSTLDIPCSKQAAPFSSRPRVNKLIEIHPVNLSDLIQGLIKDINVSYTSALQQSAYFRHSFSDGQGLSISKQKLLELITGEGSEGLYSYCKYEDKMELIVLYALKQVAYYLCFFGLHAAHLYIGNLTESFENIPERLRNIQLCIGEARLKAEKQLLESHPSLSVMETILRSNTQISRKILIVSDRAFWLPLGQKLTAMKITSVEFGTYHSTTYSDPVIKTNSETCMLEELWKSDCILLDNKNIPASFPFSEFHMILEYGGPNRSSILLSLAPKLDGLPPLHFLYVTADGEGLPNALLEDNHTDQDLKSTLDAVLHTLQKDLQEKMNKMRIVDSLNFIPETKQQQHLQSNHLIADSSKKIPTDVQLHNQGNLDEKNIVDSHNFVTGADQVNMLNQITIANSQNFVPPVEKSSSTSSVSVNVIKAPQGNQSAGVLPLSEKMDSTEAGRLPGPEAVIVVNTGNHGKNMLFSRRSSYQQILALERGGMQVVERDVYLPVDLIFIPAVCLLWYDSGSSELTVSSDTSGITTFVEDIATNSLMALSFCFCGCIMVFEGENHFLSAVMEASDSLYVSAASLDMNLQLFFSQTPKSTDQIIFNCIQNTVRINQAPSPHIPESESLVESFLTAFPSVSPLSAHMILSSGSLLDFLRWSHEQRTQAVEKYRLPPQSVSLFSALCKFGELGESKSVMTECSSVDSDISSALLQSPWKKKKRAAQDFSAAVDHPACPSSRAQLHGDCVENDKVFSPPKLRKFSHIEDMLPDLPEVFMIDQRLNMGSEGVSCQQMKYDVDAVTGIPIIDDDFINELSPNFRAYNERAGSMVDTCNFSRQSELGVKQPIRSSFPTSMPSACITSSHPTFPSAMEINNDPGNWDVSCGINQTWTDNVCGDFATSSGRNDLGSRYHEPRQELMQTPASSLSFLKQDFGCHGASQGSGWEMDYLRQMNENRKARQEQARFNVLATRSNSRTMDGSSRIRSVPPIESFSYQRNRDTPFRGQSPSDIESFRHRRSINTLVRDQSPSNEAHRYGKGRGGTKAQSHRVRKDFKAQPSINHEKSTVPSIEPTWTPLDKRARQKLTFVTYGNEKQSKLVWRHQSSPGVGCGFPKRYQEEGNR